nr:HupE/UreJ family protein [Natronocella acetinitrilica]
MNVASMIIVGILIAAAPPLPWSACYALSVLFGMSHGLANSVTLINSTNFHEFIPGLLTGASLAMLGGDERNKFLRPLRLAE